MQVSPYVGDTSVLSGFPPVKELGFELLAGVTWRDGGVVGNRHVFSVPDLRPPPL